MVLQESTMAKQNKVGADNLGWLFHIYHILWISGFIALFIFLDWWLALITVGVIGVYFFVFS